MRENKAEVNLGWSVVLLLLAALAAFVAFERENWPPLPRILFGLLAAIFAFYALVLLFTGLAQIRARIEYEAARIEAKRAEATAEVALMKAKAAFIERLENTSEETRRILLADPALARAIAGTLGPLVGLNTADEIIPFDFIDTFMGVNENREVLQLVKDWPVAGRQRQYASALTKHLERMHYVILWAGNQTARWAYPTAAADFIRHAYGERVRRVVMTGEEETA